MFPVNGTLNSTQSTTLSEKTTSVVTIVVTIGGSLKCMLRAIPYSQYYIFGNILLGYFIRLQYVGIRSDVMSPKLASSQEDTSFQPQNKRRNYGREFTLY